MHHLCIEFSCKAPISGLGICYGFSSLQEEGALVNKMRYWHSFSTIALLSLGGSLACFLVGSLYPISVFSLAVHYWAMIAILFMIVWSFLQLYMRRWCNLQCKERLEEQTKAQKESLADLGSVRDDFEQFKREMLHVCRATLKEALPRAIERRQKEEECSFALAKKSLLKALRKEFSQISWVLELLDEAKKPGK
ncbi:MAG: hypothetical protein AAGF04_01030 [Chlamydiota bacterium]